MSSALNAMGIPPAAGHKFTPVKSADGSDFVRIAVCSVSLDGKHRTTDLMKRWQEGARAVRLHPSCPFSALQVWAKTRAALAAAKRGRVCWLGMVGPWQCVVEHRDLDTWLDPGTATELHSTPSPGVSAHESELAAALVVLGVVPIGVRNGDAVFSQADITTTLGASECLSCWPEMVANHDSPAAYFAAAAHARKMSFDAIKAADPLLLFTRGKEMATIRQSSLEEKCPRAAVIGRKIGL